MLPIILLAMSQLSAIAIIMDLNRRTKKLERKLEAVQRYISWIEVEDEYAEG